MVTEDSPSSYNESVIQSVIQETMFMSFSSSHLNYNYFMINPTTKQSINLFLTRKLGAMTSRGLHLLICLASGG